MDSDNTAKTTQDRRSIRNVIIHRPMQREFTLITITVMMLSAVFTNFLIHGTIQDMVENNITSIGRVGAYGILSDASFELIVRVTLVMFVTIITVGMFGVFFLHRVAGPVHRFHQLFLKLNQSEIPSDVYLRKKDYFKEVAVEMNQLFRLMRKRKAILEQVDSILAGISDQENPQDTRRKIEEIRSILQSS